MKTLYKIEQAVNKSEAGVRNVFKMPALKNLDFAGMDDLLETTSTASRGFSWLVGRGLIAS